MYYVIKGIVIRGNKYGRKLGFPTVNFEREVKEPAPGIYAGKGTLNHKIYRAAIAINETGRIDAHLLGYRGDAYGKEVILEINKFIREFKNFKTEKELIEQIRKDLKMC